MPEPTAGRTSGGFDDLRSKILQNLDNIPRLSSILKTLKDQESMPMTEKIDLVLLVFTSESKTSKYDLISYLWNFLKILYNSMDKLVLKLVPAISIERNTDLTEKQTILFKEITTRIYYVMVYMKDTTPGNIDIMCKNVLVLSKYLMRQFNYTEFFNLAKETFFNPRHVYQIKLFVGPNSPEQDFFLEHYLTRLWEFKDCTEESLPPKALSLGALYEKCYQVFLFYLNYESRRSEAKYPLTEKLISVMLNLQLAKDNKDVCNSIKCLYSIVQLMKGDNPENACKLLYQYMGRICDKKILNSSPVAADSVATISVAVERNPFFNDDKIIQGVSMESARYILQTIKLAVNLNVEPEKPVCELKDCLKGAKKHTVTNLTRFAQKLFVAYVERLPDTEAIDEEFLNITTQLIIYHFHVLDRLTCPSRTANEHNDVRRLYSTFARRPKTNAPPGVLKIFEVLLKYALQRNLAALVNPLGLLLIKYYTEAQDLDNCDRIEWIIIMSCKHDDRTQNAAFDNCCYNWAAKKQKLTKEELTPILQTMKDFKLDYSTEMIPTCLKITTVFKRILESIAVLNYKAFRVFQECLVEMILDDSTDQCSEEIVGLLFYATENQIVNYSELIQKNREFFEAKPSRISVVQKAVLHSLEYQLYNAELRQALKAIDINVVQKGEVSLDALSMQKENLKLEHLKKSLALLQTIKTAKELKSPQEVRQVIGTLKRNIRFFQLAGLEFEEISSCKLLYDLAKELRDTESVLLAISNLMNHVHFIIKDEQCRKAFPKLILTINGEGTKLLVDHLMRLNEMKEPLQILIVFGIGNIIKLNADSGRLDKSYAYLRSLKHKIDEIGSGNKEPSVNDLQYEMISFQLFLKYAPQSQVNPLMVVRKLFSAVRLLYKACDLYALYLYDVLVELFCFSVPRYETKGLDFYICTVLKYFMSIGSVTRTVDVLLIYTNWALCCESMEKLTPIMDNLAGILGGQWKNGEEGAVVDLVDAEDQFNQRLSQAVAIYAEASTPSIWTELVCFKLNCLMARKNYIDRLYEKSRERYEAAWDSYGGINERICNHSLKMEFQQFYVNALFQLSNVFYKLNMPTKSFRFCEQSTVMISEILVNRIALTQEAYFQELPFKAELELTAKSSLMGATRNTSPVSPIEMEIAMLMNDKRKPKTTTKKKVEVVATQKDGASPKTTRKTKANSKTPARTKVKVDSPDDLPIASLSIVVAVDENSSVIGNNVAKPPAVLEEAKRKSTIRKIPVRATTTSSSGTPATSTRRRAAASAAKTETEAIPVIATRKTSRRLL